MPTFPKSLSLKIKLKTKPREAKPNREKAKAWLASKDPKEPGRGITKTKNKNAPIINK